MIFAVEGHIQMIRNGLRYMRLYNQTEPRIMNGIVKTQTRRLNRGIYQTGKDYAVQRKRGVKAEPDIRIVMDRIWEEKMFGPSEKVSIPHQLFISKEDAWAEGGYTPQEYEALYSKLNPKWYKTARRWVFEFHVIKVQRKGEE